MIKKRYPYGKAKAFNVTYDDGVLQDVRFVSLLNQYQLKGTFNLNSRLAEEEFEWVHESGSVIKRMPTDRLASLYTGHETASHTLTHPYMNHLSEDEVMDELSKDKSNLERIFHREIKGFAAPFDYYSELIENCVKKCGFEYARISEESHSFTPQKDYYRWKPTVFHTDPRLFEMTKQFIETDEELAMFQIVGHSYDLDVESMWERIESVFRTVNAQDDILPMTTIAIVNYLKAMDSAVITDRSIQNKSSLDLWFMTDKGIMKVKPGETMNF